MLRPAAPLILLLTISLLAPIRAVADQPLSKGFLDIPWGTDIRELEGFKLRHASDALRFYTKPGTVRTVRGIRVHEVVYGTHDYRFFSAFLILDSPEAFAELRNYMESRYGFPQTTFQVADDLTTHRWRYGQITMKLKSAGNGRSMKLAFYYTPISRQVNEERVESQQEGRRWLPIERDKKPEALPLLEF
jgi:hypothetical protein